MAWDSIAEFLGTLPKRANDFIIDQGGVPARWAAAAGRTLGNDRGFSANLRDVETEYPQRNTAPEAVAGLNLSPRQMVAQGGRPELADMAMNDAMGSGVAMAPITKARSIRASRSIPSEDGFAYHATNVERANDIAQSKLMTHKPWEFTEQDMWPDGSTKKRAYFSRNAGATEAFAPEDGPSVVLRTRETPTLRRESGTGDLFTEKPIDPKDLEVLTVDGWRSIIDEFLRSGD